MVTESVENAIKEFLDSLTKKTSSARSLVDREALKAIKDQIKKASDPIARLTLARELREASVPKQVEPAPHPGLSAFVANGKAWAEENGFTAADLQRYAKVPVEVLRDAGFTVPRLSERPSSRRRAPRLDPKVDVLPVAKKLGASWKLSDLSKALDRDVATTRNYVNKLVEAGIIVVSGKDASGQGRAATLYKVK